MSPGIRTISQLDLPLKVLDFDIRCPKCGGMVVIKRIGGDGMVVVGCDSEPAQGTRRWEMWDQRCYREVDWGAVYRDVLRWFNSFYRYRPVTVETVKRRRRMKWRRG